LHRACVEDRALGFGARSCIHPSQVPVINAAFAPTAAEIDQALKIRVAYAKAKAAGRGSLLLDDGTFIDEAVDLRAQDLLQAAT
jgi:citrate lyase subunit beta/citryl-CoA lyase